MRNAGAMAPAFWRMTIFTPYPAHGKCVKRVLIKFCEPERLMVIIMKLTTVIELIDAQVLTNNSPDVIDKVFISSACGSDLMSDVLAFAKEEELLLTGLENIQVVRTAELKDIKAICFVRGISPEQSIIDFAKDRGMLILQTKLPMFIACGILYKAGLMCEAA